MFSPEVVLQFLVNYEWILESTTLEYITGAVILYDNSSLKNPQINVFIFLNYQKFKYVEYYVLFQLYNAYWITGY